MGHLRGVGMDQGEQQRRDGNGHPVVARPPQQRTQHGTTEHQLLADGRQQPYGQIAPTVFQYHVELLLGKIGQLGHLLLQPGRGNDGTGSGQRTPEQHGPGTGTDIAARHLRPAHQEEQGKNGHAVGRQADNHQLGIQGWHCAGNETQRLLDKPRQQGLDSHEK